jgi:hypothetical protein
MSTGEQRRLLTARYVAGEITHQTYWEGLCALDQAAKRAHQQAEQTQTQATLARLKRQAVPSTPAAPVIQTARPVPSAPPRSSAPPKPSVAPAPVTVDPEARRRHLLEATPLGREMLAQEQMAEAARAKAREWAVRKNAAEKR